MGSAQRVIMRVVRLGFWDLWLLKGLRFKPNPVILKVMHLSVMLNVIF